jgi:hypothetical protein
MIFAQRIAQALWRGGQRVQKLARGPLLDFKGAG